MNPIEVVKTQMQTHGNTTVDKSAPRQTMLKIGTKIFQTEGVRGLWAGLKPNVTRCFLVNAAELGTYDHAKVKLIQLFNLEEGFLTHVGASGIAGLASALTSTPADVVKTRLMNQAGGVQLKEGPKAYSGIADAAKNIFRNEGVGAFYKGFTPILIRKVSWCSIFFVCYEQVRVMI